MSSLRIPIATYRLQFNKRFRFEDAKALVPYLHRLGISDLYASPIFKARIGSSHGYDVTDPSRLNPELGTDEEFEALVQRIKHYGMGLLLDIVPNHMAASPENPWWMDLLENGPNSPYATFFDIDWSPIDSSLKNKIIFPILDRPYHQALENQEIVLKLEEAGFFIFYREFKLPLNVKSYKLVVSSRMKALESTLGSEHPAVQQLKKLVDAIEHLSSVGSTHPQKALRNYQNRQAIKEELWCIANTSAEVKTFLRDNITLFNGEKGTRRSFDLLDKLLAQQIYRLDFWKTAREQINYRRFFDISDLVGVRVELPQVFEATHALILSLVNEGKSTGLRVDHIDGLYNPLEYLFRLQHYIAPQTEESGELSRFYIVVEKILASDELLPQEWPVSGTTGYDFLNVVNALFVDRKGGHALDDTYSRLTEARVNFKDMVYEKKRQVMSELFTGEVHALGQHLACLAQQGWAASDFSPEELTNAIIEVTACLPVYRTYIRAPEVSTKDRLYLEHATQEARRRNPTLMVAALGFLKQVLFLNFPDDFNPEQKEMWLRFVLRWQQLTGAIMAKGQEDTAFYTYNRLISLNEVGSNPGFTSLSVEEFHHRNLTRLSRYPYSMNATSTHDTKRSEDVRARINVLSEMPATWESCLIRWSQWNQPEKQTVSGRLVPDLNTQMFLYQTMVGAWPLSQEEVPEFKNRLKAHMVKAAREAKVFTNWLSPDTEYEAALLEFVEAILKSPDQDEFLSDFLQFQGQIAYYGALNALAQVLLKITSPGVPDFYQGTELWDLSLVDPDNRRPVDFKKRIKLLYDLMQKELSEPLSLIHQILNSWEDGRVNFYVTYKALNFRRTHGDLFLEGNYIPLQVGGKRREHVCAFARRQGRSWALTVVPRLLTKLVGVGILPLGPQVWGKSPLLLPEDAPEHWLNVFTGENLTVSMPTKGVPLSRIFSLFPVALLASNY